MPHSLGEIDAEEPKKAQSQGDQSQTGASSTGDPAAAQPTTPQSDGQAEPANSAITQPTEQPAPIGHVKLPLTQELVYPQDGDGNVNIIQLVNNLFTSAKQNRASDIHIEPQEKSLLIRFRIDGEFKEYFIYPLEVADAIVTRIMVQSGLKIDERRLPQDGKIAFKVGTQQIDMRVSTFPTMYGDKVVLRLLDRDAKAKSLTNLGYEGKDLEIIQKNLGRTYGMILVTGPTGSGKSTTLFSMLSSYDPFTYNISTLEDPIEYVMTGVNQAQVHAEIGFDFADGLRCLVRQDPDIIMIGEIRDKISANLAVQAALTGHLVFATVHANTAAATIQRLSNMGVDSFLASSALNVIISQRLVRRICSDCKIQDTPPQKYLDSIGDVLKKLAAGKQVTFMRGKGCAKCGNTGYKGRIAINEVLPVTPAISQVIIENPISSYIEEAALKEGFVTILESGIKKVLEGLTTLEEVLIAVDASFA